MQQSGIEQAAEPSTSLALVPTSSTEDSGSIQAISQSCEKLATAVVHLVQSTSIKTFTSGATVSEICKNIATLQTYSAGRQLRRVLFQQHQHRRHSFNDGIDLHAITKSPFERAKEQLPPISQAYAENDMKLTDWAGNERTPIHGEPTAKKLRDQYQTAVGGFVQLDRRETYWYRYIADWGTDYEGQKVDFIDVMAEPDVTRHYWRVMRGMVNQDMFDMKIETSPQLSKFEGLKPHFPLTGVQTLPDVDDKFPTTSDVVPITQGELESLHIMSNIVVKMNNTQLICARLLDDWSRQQVWRVQEHREAFLTATNLMKTATEIQKDAAIKCSVLSKLVRRRDAMLRQNINPVYRGNQFISA